ncbi:hypothetical protein CfE428DRAFT_3614 [Chthoniobacter flavus Ellin428]|uniref:Uncharacterized protein n=2 Tax=Chthoniobacter flavus TaxID=191863 RepID=B4D3X6_9BACT|nr:hypothetical protein CfE428DRAFT_3614 [Chthoniobacter flavus Ellin428]TCO93540.1 hypothetical protein EV701_104244 [Chthoniobacter flavus]
MAEALPVDLHLSVDKLTGWEPEPTVVVLKTSEDWVLVHRLDDGFFTDGYVAMRRSLIHSLGTTRHDAFRKRVMQEEKRWPQVIRAPAIDLKNTAAVLRSIQQRRQFAIVLRETVSEWHSIHCRIEQITDTDATLLGFDGAGKWQRRPLRVDLDEITRVVFGSRYLKVYEKYA